VAATNLDGKEIRAGRKMTTGGVRKGSMWTFVCGLREASICRYLVVGAALFVIDLMVFMVQVRGIGIDLRIAQLISRTVGATVGFWGHKLITFRDLRTDSVRAGRTARQGLLYVVVIVLNILISPFVLQGVVDLLTKVLPLAKIITEAIIVSETYLLLRLIFWPEKENHDERC
jgi:putative flippase GtrA